MRDAATIIDGVEFRIEEERPRPTTRVLVVHGDADLHAAPEVRERLRGAIDDGVTIVVVDLSDAALIDSTILGVLLGGMKRLRERDGEVRIVTRRADLRRVFEVTMLDGIFALYDTQEKALTSPLSMLSAETG